MKVPLTIDLKGKVAVVTGGGGVLCGYFSEALAACGAKVAVLDLRKEAAEKVVKKIIDDGGTALAVEANVLQLESLQKAEKIISEEFGTYNILINGAGGNHPKGTTSKDFLFKEDLEEKSKENISFFDLEPEGVKFVFDLNFIGTLLPTQVFAKRGCNN